MNLIKNLLQKMSNKFDRYAIRNLMTFIVVGMGIVFIFNMLPPTNIVRLIDFDKTEIANGQIWRLFSFVFIPPESSYLFIILTLYFYWLLGSSLENEWGAFKFNIFYLFGIIGTVVSGMITGYATNYFINMSLFFAFAILHPNFQILLFFLLPIKIKYLAYLNAVFFLYMLIINSWPVRIALLVSLLNIIIFFGSDFFNSIKQQFRRAKWKRDMRR